MAVDPSFFETVENVEYYGPIEQIRFYDILGYDQLVPNMAVAQLLNAKGEIIVDNTLYRVTDAGTFYCAPGKQADLNTNLNQYAVTTGQFVSEDLYTVAPGIYLLDTFRIDCPEIEDATSFDYPELDDYFPEDELDNEYMPIGTRSLTYNIPNINSFPRFKSGAKTKAGKLLSKLFGDNSNKTVKLSKKRRLRGKLYDYNYGFYSEIGAVAEMQKKNWIGWSGTKADKMVLAWRSIVLELDAKIPAPPTGTPTQPYYGGTKYTTIPGLNKDGYVVTMLNLDIDNAYFKSALRQGEKALLSYLKGLIKNQTSWTDRRLDAVVAVNRGKAHLVIVDQDIVQ